MDKLEKVIKGLECCCKSDCDICPYSLDEWTCDSLQMKANALALLKAQEPVEPNIIDTANSKLYHNDMFKNYYCGNCGEFLHTVNRKDLFCSQCGRPVKWE